MSFSLVPNYSFNTITDVSPDFLRRHGITLLLLDLDNTMAPYGTLTPPAHIADWVKEIRQSGVELFIITNNRGCERVEALSAAFGMGYIKGANKPFAKGIRQALEQFGKTPGETALAGDQIFTDVIAANAAGVTSIVVRPIKIHHPAFNVRYWLEAPFRAMCRNKLSSKPRREQKGDTP